MKIRAILALGAAMCLATGIGCESDSAKVSKGDLKSIERSSMEVEVGSTRQEVQSAFKKGNFVRLGETMVGGAKIEEWKLEAYTDDDWNRSRDQYIKFYYFMNDTLVDISNQRINFRDPGVVANWKTNFSDADSD